MRAQLVAACRELGPVDSVYWGEDDAELRVAAASARRLGFSGKSTLRPDQVAAINLAFA